MSSDMKKLSTFDDAPDQRSFWLCDKRFLEHNLGDELVNIGVFGKVQ